MEHKNRKIKHADEQLKRSGRLLYVLQRRVDELNRHLNQKSFDVKPTKKVIFLSLYLWPSRLNLQEEYSAFCCLLN